ncbi:MAG: type II toxin-antitoxin system RelE/ParE family toxin, partial [bacterium]
AKNVYRVLFAIRDDIVYVLYVRHSSQAPLTLNDVEELRGGI